MRRLSLRIPALLLLLAVAFAGSAAAQSQDRDYPTQVISGEINGELDNSGNEYFYSFVAGPGELTTTVDVKSSVGQALLTFELLGKNASTALLCCEYAQADGDGQSARDVKSIRLGKRQTVILHATVGKGGTGTYRVRFSGAATHEG